MKKIVYAFMSLSLCFMASCSQDDGDVSGTPSGKTQKVTLSVSDLKMEVGEMGQRVTAPVLPTYYITYAIFPDVEGAMVTSVVDVVAENGKPAENIELTLNVGKYKVYAFASYEKIEGADWRNTAAKVLIKFAPSKTNVLFRGETTIEVSESPIKETIKLTRAVGKVEIVITDVDKIPADVKAIIPNIKAYSIVNNWLSVCPTELGIENLSNVIYGSSDWSHLTMEREEFEKITPDNPLTFYSLQTTGESSPGFPTWFRNKGLYLQLSKTGEFDPKVTPNTATSMVTVATGVRIYANKITRYTGTVVGNPIGGISIEFQEEWSDIIEGEVETN